MPDGDLSSSHVSFNNDTSVLVATTIAALVFAGSAFLWRSGSPLPRAILALRRSAEGSSLESDCKLSMKSDSSENYQISAASNKSNSVGTHVRMVTSTAQDNNDGEMKDTKTQRPKERRRRGKDSSKELLKATKKLKGLEKLNPSADSEGDDGSHPHGSTQTPDDVPQSSSTSGSVTISSARRVVSSTSSHFAIDASQNSPTSQLHEMEARVASSSTPTVPSPSMPTPKSAPRVVDSECPRQGAQVVAVSPDPGNADVSSQIQNLGDSTISLFPNGSNGSSTYTSSSASETTSEPAITPSTSPSLSLSENIPLNSGHIHASEPQTIYSTPQIGSSNISTSYNHSTKHSKPWDWEGVPQVPNTEGIYRKPPRFHSQSRGSRSPVPIIPGPSSSYPFPNPDSSTLLPSSSANNDSTLFTFPTLNGPASASINGLSPSGSGCAADGTNTTTNGNTPHSTRNTPRRTPTPSSGTNTPPPSLSAQTQIASLRGALEAARLREEKMRVEIERLGKELEMIRWESIASRRRETELQNQLHHTTLQLQTYVGIYSSAPSQAHTLVHSNGSNTGSDSGTGPSTSTPAAHPSPQVPQSPLSAHLTGNLSSQALSPNGLRSPAPLSSPVALPGSMGRSSLSASSSLPHTPHLGYPPHHPNANLFSMFYPIGLGMNHHFHGSANSRPGSVAGSSVGSLSPDLAGPSSPRLSLLLDRGKRRMKARRLNEINTKSLSGWEEGADGWIVNNDGKDHDEDDIEEEEEVELSEVLADAILKRPESLKINSVKKKSSQLIDQSDLSGEGVTVKPGLASSPSEAQPEFVFPSLSNLGNVHYAERYQHQTEEDRERETAIAELAASVAATMQAATIIEEPTTRSPGMTSEEWPNADAKDADERDVHSDLPPASTPQEDDSRSLYPTNDNDLAMSKFPVLPQNDNVQPPVSN